MSKIRKAVMQAAAGAAAGEAVYVDDVFSTYLYTGTGSAQTITNGVDLDGEGGLVWIKGRSNTGHGTIFDTERGVGNFIMTSLSNAEGSATAGTRLTAFNSDGFSLGTDPGSALNFNTYDYASWTFRKQPGFFDVVTYTGDGASDRYISHNLGSTPGFVAVKRLDSSQNWFCAFRDKAASLIYMSNAGTFGFNSSNLITNNASGATYNKWSSTQVGLNGTITISATNSTYGHNINGAEYVMYLWADGNETDAQIFGADGDEAGIKVGAYTGNGSTNGPEIDLGFEPQYILMKSLEGDANDLEWILIDTMRGIATSGNDPVLSPNSSASEDGYWGASDKVDVTSTGFKLTTNIRGFNFSGAKYGYVAIRRPHKPAEEFAATDLFKVAPRSNTSGADHAFVSNFPVDMGMSRNVLSATEMQLGSRMTGDKYLQTPLSNAEATVSDWGGWDSMNSVSLGFSKSAESPVEKYGWMFRRAPGFFDVVAYTGTGANLTLDHNLGVVPEFMIVKGRTITAGWHCYHKDVGNTKAIPLNTNGAASTSSFYWNNTSPTATQATLGAFTHYNVSNETGILYLFATVPGISKVGSYTGTGADVDVDCGFTSGARFVLVKRTDSTGDWYVWDSERGIVDGNDPYLFLNSTAAQVTSTDYIDPLSSGFTITSSAPAALNASGGTYIFLAIA
jgi:hypothetical protein